MNKFWKWVRNKAPTEGVPDEEERTLILNGTIAEESWFDDDVTPALFKSELESGGGNVTVWINSPGGDWFAAAQIYNMLTSYKGHVTVKIDGLAASAASVIAMAGDSVLVSPVSMIMIHNPATMAMGDRGDMQKAIEMLDSVKDSIINAYVAKTGLSRNKLSKLMDDETWMDANKAVELRFADDIMKRTGSKDEPDEVENSEPDEASGDEPHEPKESTDTKPKESVTTGMLFSTKKMAQTFTNKVTKHFKAETKPEETEIKTRDADELQRRLDFFHSFM